MTLAKEYDAIFYRQPGNPNYIMANLVIGVSDLIDWISVPRKTTEEGGKILFQRALNDARLEKLKLHYEECITPNSVLITLCKDVVSNIKEIENLVEGTNNPILGKLKLNIKLNESLDDETKIKEVIYRLKERLSKELIIEFDIDEDSNVDGESDEIDINDIKSNLREILIKLEELLQKKENDEDINEDEEQAMIEFCDEYLRPAFLVDGQHRVYGAYEKIVEKWENNPEYEILLSVSSIINCDWKESVFQFVIINQTAEKIEDKFLSSIISTSLTSNELQGFKQQFENSGAHVGQAVAINNLSNKEIFINSKNINPFYNNIEFGIPNECPKALRYSTVKGLMNKLIKFNNATSTISFGNPYSNLKNIIQSDMKISVESWNDEYWMQFIIYFWYLVEQQFTSDKKLKYLDYKDSESGSTNLSLKVSMNYIQDCFVDSMVKNYELYKMVGKEIKIIDEKIDFDSFKQVFDFWIKSHDNKDYKFFECEWKGLSSYKRENDKYEGIHNAFESQNFSRTKLFRG